jgi:hypothetical protein
MTPSKSVLLLAASGLALTLAGCKVDNRPLLARFGGEPAPAAYAALPQPGLPDINGAPAYPASDLPPAGAYPYAERAHALDSVAYGAPPDYGFAYGGEQPWVWQADDDGLMFAEPYGEDYRFYYYEPGAAYPYFVRDNGYGYAYGPDGALLALFDAAGALIAADRYDRYYPEARDYWSRGYDLHRAYGSGRPYPVDRGLWAERAPRLRQAEQSWIEAPQRQPAWRDWRASQGERFARSGPQVQNGRSGFDQGRHQSWARQGRGDQIASAPMPQVVAPRDPGRWQRNGGHGGGEHGGRGTQAQAQSQPQWQGGGRGGGHGGGQVAQAQPQWQGGGHGGGHGGDPGGGKHGGRWGGGATQTQAQSQPQWQSGGRGGGHGGGQVAQAQPQWQGGGHGGGHSGDHGGGKAQPQAQGGGHGGGQGGGGNGGGGNGGGHGGGGHGDKHGR